jgi:glycine dehydrogenase subunit 1
VRRRLAKQGIAAATPLPEEYGRNLALFAASELHQTAELETLKEALTEVLA